MKTLIESVHSATVAISVALGNGTRPKWMPGILCLSAMFTLLLLPSTTYAQRGQLIRRQIDSESLKTNLYGDSSLRPYMVYLPPSYDHTTNRYPVIYALHGYGDSETTLTIPSPAVPAAIPPFLDSMIGARQLGEVIVVFVCATNRLYGSFYLNSAVIGDYESYIVADLVSQIDGSFRTIATRESRGIVGYSMGGWGAAHLALKFPDVFSALVAEAGFYDSQSAWFDGLSRLLAAAIPGTLAQFDALSFPNNAAQALFAGLLPNTQRPPLFTDYPYEVVAGRLTTNTAAIQRASDRDVQNGDLQRYAAHPTKLTAIKIVHGTQDPVAPIAGALSFTNALKAAGIEVAYEQHSGGHIFRADLALPFLITNLIGAQKYIQRPGTVLAWGAGSTNITGSTVHYGQSVTPVVAQSGVIAIAAGVYHTLALKNDGRVIAWGLNDEGQTSVPETAMTGVIAIAAGGGGGGHSVALKADGSLVAWGENEHGQTTIPAAAQSGVTAIAAGYSHTVALKTDASVVAWGRNNHGQTNVPPQVQGNVAAIAAGYFHTVALTRDGRVVAWGFNEGDDETAGGQTNVPGTAQSGVVAIAAGAYHTVALKSDGRVVAWGSNTDDDGNVTGQTNVPLAALSGVMAIAAGESHTVALKSDGNVVAWGAGALNIGDEPHLGQSSVPSAALNGVTAIAAGGFHTVAIVGEPAPFRIRRTEDKLILSWSTNGIGFNLQSTLDLDPPVIWIDVTNAPALLNDQWAITNTLSGDSRLYRLRKP